MFWNRAGILVLVLFAGDDGADTVAEEECVMFVDVARAYWKEFDSLVVDVCDAGNGSS